MEDFREALLTEKQRAFLELYLKTGDANEAALTVYDCKSPDSARAVASWLKRSPPVQQYLQSVAAEAALMVVRVMRSSRDDKTKLAASKDILDRAGYKPVERTASVNLNIRVGERDNPAVQKLAKKYEDELFQTLQQTPVVVRPLEADGGEVSVPVDVQTDLPGV